jgi:hypothetical protein
MLVVILFCMTACADKVTLKDGRTLDGRITLQTDKEISIEISRGDMKVTLHYPREEVTRIEYGSSPAEALSREYEEALAATDAGSADAWCRLGEWCSKRLLDKNARTAYEKAIALDPGHEFARRALGYSLYEGKWLLRDEIMLAKGFVRFEGDWVTPDEKRKIAEDRKLEEERKAADAEKAKIEALNDKVERLQNALEKAYVPPTFRFRDETTYYYPPIIVWPQGYREPQHHYQESDFTISGERHSRRSNLSFTATF